MVDISQSLMLRSKVEDPRRIGFWKVGKQIGSGASGRVKLARHSKSGQFAAIKIISKLSLGSRITIARMADDAEHTQLAIEREIVVMKLLDHPNLMRLYDVWETSTELYLILEYVQGGELFDYLCNNGKLPVPEALHYFQQIIAAMDYCHRFNIAHRDLKPENILLDKDFNVKIADFGMAAWQANNDGLLRTSCGSPHYAAPEIISGSLYNGSASDIWSCGVILFALLAGKLPFDDEDCVALLRKVKTGQYDTPPDMHPFAQDLISKMLTLDAAQRITMPNIMAHPFFRLYPPRAPTRQIPSLTGSTRLITDKSLIDPDIFANLRTLWHGMSEEAIVESLTNGEPTLQKGIYDLLVRYRANNAATYQDEEEKITQDRLERRSKKTKAAAVTIQGLENTAVSHSPSSHPPRDGPPTPRRALRQCCSSSRSLDIPTIDSALRVHTPSPNASPALVVSSLGPFPPSTVELQDDSIRAFCLEITQHLDVSQTDAIAAHQNGLSPNSDATMMTFAYENSLTNALSDINLGKPVALKIGDRTGTKPLSVKRKPRRLNLAVEESEKENISRNDDHPITGRVVKLINRAKKSQASHGENRTRALQSKLVKKGRSSVSPAISDTSSSTALSAGPFSLPAFSSSPKRSWLGNVFNLRPPPLSLFSIDDIQTTRDECKRLLMEMHVWVVLEDNGRFGILKCRLNEVKEPSGVMNLLKSVKFRVDFYGPHMHGRVGEEVLMVSLEVTYEKGSAETFKEVCRRLKQGWSLAETTTKIAVVRADRKPIGIGLQFRL